MRGSLTTDKDSPFKPSSRRRNWPTKSSTSKQNFRNSNTQKIVKSTKSEPRTNSKFKPSKARMHQPTTCSSRRSENWKTCWIRRIRMFPNRCTSTKGFLLSQSTKFSGWRKKRKSWRTSWSTWKQTIERTYRIWGEGWKPTIQMKFKRWRKIIILPYKILTQKMSDWRSTWTTEGPKLKSWMEELGNKKTTMKKLYCCWGRKMKTLGWRWLRKKSIPS